MSIVLELVDAGDEMRYGETTFFAAKAVHVSIHNMKLGLHHTNHETRNWLLRPFIEARVRRQIEYAVARMIKRIVQEADQKLATFSGTFGGGNKVGGRRGTAAATTTTTR